MSTPTGDRLARLARAVEVFLEHRSSGGIGKDLLESHADLRDLLEPMIADDSVASATITAGAAGRVLGDFRLIREIGRGGMGVVYEAHQLSLDRRVAVKLLSGSLALRPDSVARFKREALAAGKLRHPGIVEVYAVGSDGDTHWFAMELVEGGPLRPGPDRRAAVSRCALVAAALQHAHEHGVVHRDVKPSNVLYRERDGRVVLTDFGLACLEDQPQITATGALAGTPSYLAPEQLLGEAVDHRADVYALGATLYELLTGHPPFEGETSAVVLHRILTQEPEDPRRHVPDLDADLAAVVLKTLEKKPEDRYPTAGALGLELRAWLEGRSVAARPLSAPSRLWRRARRSPLRAALTLLVPALLGLATYVALTRPALRAGLELQHQERFDRALQDGFLELEVGNNPEALALLDEAFRLEPQSPEALYGVVSARHRLRRTEEALRLLDAHPASPVRDRLRALVLHSLGRGDEAEAVEGGLPEPRDPIDWLILGSQELDRARAGPGEGDKEAARRAVELLRRAVVAAPRPRAFYDFRWACAAGRAEDRSAIEDSIAALRARWPDSAQAWFWIGYACTKEDHARAAEAYRRSLALGLTLPTVYHNLARSLESARDFDGALEQLRLGRARHPKNERILGALAFLLQERGDAAGALEAYRAVVEHHPESARGHNNLGSALEKAGDREGAEREYRLALERDPDYAVAHLNLGSVLLGRRTWDEAATHLEAALVRDPKNAITLGNLGSLRIELGDAQAAKDLLLRAVAVDPREPTARFNLARAHQKLGELDDAVREYERVVKDHPDHAIAWRGLASILVAPGFSGRDVPRGLAAAERSVALTGGTNADALLVLSEAELQSRRPDAALRVIRRAVALPPTDAELTRRLQAQLRRCREAAER